MRDHTRNSQLTRITHRAVAGAVAGFAATIPMSVLMLLWHRRLPWRHRDSLPPRQITENVLHAAGLSDDLGETQQLSLTVISHFAYGAALGAGYGCVAPSLPPASSVGTGVLYGVSVWAGSYLGWLPAVGLYRSATNESPDRNAMMLASHIVWGGALGLLTSWIDKRYAPSEQPSRDRPEHSRSGDTVRSEVIA